MAGGTFVLGVMVFFFLKTRDSRHEYTYRKSGNDMVLVKHDMDGLNTNMSKKKQLEQEKKDKAKKVLGEKKKKVEVFDAAKSGKGRKA